MARRPAVRSAAEPSALEGTTVTTRSSYEPGTPCWVDLMSPDVDASTASDTGLFGWQAGGDEGGVGGLMPMPPGRSRSRGGVG